MYLRVSIQNNNNMDKQAHFTINRLVDGQDICTIGRILDTIDTVPGVEIAEDGYLMVTDWDAYNNWMINL